MTRTFVGKKWTGSKADGFIYIFLIILHALHAVVLVGINAMSDEMVAKKEYFSHARWHDLSQERANHAFIRCRTTFPEAAVTEGRKPKTEQLTDIYIVNEGNLT